MLLFAFEHEAGHRHVLALRWTGSNMRDFGVLAVNEALMNGGLLP